ncbi:MAG: L-serine ammonia-lyase, iron-sulfur-dependent subunit beta [Bacillota bacterium]
MGTLSLFDTVGPVMIGPSSSHTAGAVRIGKMTRDIVGEKIDYVKVFLHGSFKETYQGHGTDRALIGGLLGFSTESSLIKDSFRIAKDKGIEFEFIPQDLDNVHPNTAKLVVEDINGELTTVVGSSIGGGNIVITELNGMEVELTGENFTLIAIHDDRPGRIAKIGQVLVDNDLNIAYMTVIRLTKGGEAVAIIELDQRLDQAGVTAMEEIDGVNKVQAVKQIK